MRTKKFWAIAFILILSLSSYSSIAEIEKESTIDKTTYNILTSDEVEINLIRYNGTKAPILMLPGMFENHLIFDFDNETSLSKYLSNEGYDTWILDLRSHDADGDPKKDNENISKEWDFDKHYLEKDMVAAIEFIKNETGFEKIFLLGHSMGGYLSYAYAELINQSDIAGIISIASTGVAFKIDVTMKILRSIYCKKTIKGEIIPRLLAKKLDLNNNIIMKLGVKYESFYKFKTNFEKQKKFIETLDAEPIGVVIDMLYGFDEDYKDGHWWDPQTGYDYTGNLKNITVPVIFIGGKQDESDKIEDIAETFNYFGSSDKEIHILNEYGHVDLLLGEDAEKEVYQLISNWLDKR